MKNLKFLAMVVVVSATLLLLASCGQKETTLDIAGLSFILPDGWSVKEVAKESNKNVAKISVPDPKYKVVIPMSVAKSDQIMGENNFLMKESASGVKIYANECGREIVCHYVVHNGNTYIVYFGEPESDEVAPVNLNGVWSPSTTLTKGDLVNFLATVK